MTEIAGAGEEVSTGAATPRGTLRASAPMVLAHVTLMPIAIRFCALHPEVVLELVAEDPRVIGDALKLEKINPNETSWDACRLLVVGAADLKSRTLVPTQKSDAPIQLRGDQTHVAHRTLE